MNKNGHVNLLKNQDLIISIEKAILSTFFFDKEIYINYRKKLKPEYFFYPKYKYIYKRMLEVGVNFDEFNILQKDSDGRNEAHEQDLIEILSSNALTSSSIKTYIEDMKERSLNSFINNELKKISENEELSTIQKLLLLEQITERTKQDNKEKIFQIKTISNIKETTPVFFLQNFLPLQEGEINLITAKGGSGKTYLSLLLALKLIKEENKKVFMWLSEDDLGICKNRIKKLLELDIYKELALTKENESDLGLVGKETEIFHFVYKEDYKRIQVNDKFYELLDMLMEYDFIFLDPLIGFFGADENNNSDARFFMNLLNFFCAKYKKTIGLIHHSAKGENNARGAGAFIDACRIHYIIDKIDEENTHMRKLKLEKANHFNLGMNEFKIQLFKKDSIIKYKKDIVQINSDKIEEQKLDYKKDINSGNNNLDSELGILKYYEDQESSLKKENKDLEFF